MVTFLPVYCLTAEADCVPTVIVRADATAKEVITASALLLGLNCMILLTDLS
jgi:hypothetical protein